MKLCDQTVFMDRDDVYNITVKHGGMHAEVVLKEIKLLPKHIDELVEDLKEVRKLMR